MLRIALPQRCVWLVWVVLLAIASHVHATTLFDEPRFEPVGDAQAIPDAVATALAEDASGLLWIGSTAGLIRYDGYQFRRYTRRLDDPTSLGGNLIRALHASRDGRVWIGTDVDGLSVFNPATGNFHTYRPGQDRSLSLSTGAIHSIAEDLQGRIWIGTRGGGLDRLDPVSGTIEHFLGDTVDSGGRLDDDINSLLVDRAGDLWIGHNGGVSRRLANSGEVQAVFADPNDPGSLAGRRVYGLFQADDGTIWVGSREGDLVLIDPLTLASRRISTPGPEEAGGSASIFAFSQTGPERIWLGRSNGIEIRASDGRLLRRVRHDPTMASSLRGNDIRALLRDRSGSLWAAGFGSGLQRHDPGNRSIRVVRSRLLEDGRVADSNVSAVLQLRNGEVWLGTRGSGVIVLDADFRSARRPYAGVRRAGLLTTGWITNLAQTADDAVWLGSRDGLYRYDPARASLRSFHAEQGMASPSVRRLWVGRGGQLWVGSNDGVFEVDPITFAVQRLLLEDGSPIARDINAMAEEDDGSLWVGGALGLFHRPPGSERLRQVIDPARAPLPQLSVVGLLADRRGRLWIDTAEGLYLREAGAKPGEFEEISQQLGLVGQSFGANLLDDERGRIWTQMFMLDPEARTVYPLTPADGVDFGTSWFRAYARGANGRLLFGGSQGLLVIDPEAFQPWAYQPPLVITELRIDSQPVARNPGNQGLVLAAQQRSFSVEFSALDYSAPQSLRYRYRLLGYDNQWLDTEPNYRVATYANLWPGEYILEIQGSNRNGDWSKQELRLPVRVLPAYWQTGWFLLAVLLALSAGVMLIVRQRTGRMRQRSLKLQALVEQRTRELLASKDNAESALLQLQGTQQQLVEAEKLASLGQLVAGIAHEINTPIGIALTAASHLEDLAGEQERRLADGKLRRSDLDRWRETTREGMQLILGSLRRAHTLIASFKQVAVDQTSEQRRLVSLDRFLEEVRAALEPSCRQGGHRIEVDCPAQIELDTYPGALFQVFTNLITNSITHGFPDGRRGEFRIEARRGDSRVTLRYRDNGCGMPAEIAARAFEPFFTTRRGQGGSGLGLHLVHNLTTQLLGGRIQLQCPPGQGCEFLIDLPLSAPPRALDQSSAG